MKLKLHGGHDNVLKLFFIYTLHNILCYTNNQSILAKTQTNKANTGQIEYISLIFWRLFLIILGLSTISAIRQCFFADLTITLMHLPINSGSFLTKT